MRTAISAAGDKLVALLAPRATAAAACRDDSSWCDGGCPFWWWRRAYHVVCDNGDSFIRYSACGSGNC
ncbi:hypothetical protein U5640_38935 [Streptomyces sp. SS7]|uniref:hypothetical protein n=1 Tax=Streptomyces sp. SS7 TaxID=3108485 RepID=UPI0030EDF4C9